MMTREEIAKVIADYFAGKPVLRAYLFGSVARGEADEKSDVDVLVELDYKHPGSLWGAYVDMLEELQRRLGRKVDLVDNEGLSKHIAPYVNRDKILVYER